MPETQEHPPPILKTLIAGPPGGDARDPRAHTTYLDAGDPGAPTTYLEYVDGGPPWDSDLRPCSEGVL
jgi:hypothetical protein